MTFSPLLAIRPSTQLPETPTMLPIQPTRCTGTFFKRKRMLLLVFAHHPLPFPAGYLLRGSFVNVRMLLPAPVVFALFVLSSASRVLNTHGQLLYVAAPLTSRLCASTSRWSSYCSLWFRFSLSRQSLFLSIIRLSRSFSNAAILLFCVSISLWRDFMILSDLQFRKSVYVGLSRPGNVFSSAKIRSIASSTLLISLSFSLQLTAITIGFP